MNAAGERLILVTGATGYIGGRLVKELEARGERLRCLVRRPEALVKRLEPRTGLVQGDVLDGDALRRALDGVHSAYYLIHALGSTGDLEAIEEEAAERFAVVAKESGVKRIIYLGGLCDDQQPGLSPHMRGRFRAGEALCRHGVQTLEFRASVVIGSGSLSFELIRSLVRRLPVMVTPRWVSVQAQPIAISDVLEYLVLALDLEVHENRIYEIGGADCMSYGGLMQEYARIRGLRRWMIAVPVLTPRLSSLWLNLVTPVYARIGRKLIDGMTLPSVVRENSALRDFDVHPMGVREAIEQALRNEDQDFAETHWADALSSVGTVRHWAGMTVKDRYLSSRSAVSKASPAEAFKPIRQIGGRNGWYFGTWFWRLRGLIDRLIGGVGMRRGRRDPDDLRVGDVVDCWRVQSYDPPRQLTLQAEMRLPGRAWLQFDVEPDGNGSRIRLTNMFDPTGWSGVIYRNLLRPLDQVIFAGLLRRIVCLADQSAER